MKNPLPFVFSRFTFVRITLLVSLISNAVYVTPVQAAGMVVNTDVDETTANGLCSLREAITNANEDAATYPDCAAGSGPDTITFAGDYTITLVDQLPTIPSEMIIIGNGADKTIIQANANPGVATYVIFDVWNGNLTLDRVRLQNGAGGIVQDRGRLTVINSTISDNTDNGIWSAAGYLTVTNSIFLRNKASSGGAIFIYAEPVSFWNSDTLNVTDSFFSGNSADGNGGAISIEWRQNPVTGETSSRLTVTNSTFLNNKAGAAGGGLNVAYHSRLILSNSTLVGNSVTAGSGGGIAANGGSILSITDSTFTSNTADTGGGLYFQRGQQVSVMGSTFNSNSATTLGGGIRGIESGNVAVTNSTFSGNIADTGGGMDLFRTTLYATNNTLNRNSATTMGWDIHVDLSQVTFTNTIVANSPSEGNCSGGIIDGGHNLDSGTSCKWGAIKGSLRNIDPRLGPLADNGGPTLTFALLEGSPAIDNGDDNACNGVDQRGMIRPQGAHCDIGAYEVEYRPAISGNVGVAGATLSYTDGTPKTVTADSKGNYSISVPVGWSGTVQPSKIGYTFTPTNKSYNNLQGDQTNQDYTAQLATGGADTTGVFRPSNGLLYLKNKNESGFADIALNYGMGGDYPVTGDWDGDGTDTIGVYRDGTFYLRNSNTNGFAEIVFPFGQAGDQPVTGDWNGDGVDTIGVFRNGTFYLRNTNDAGAPDATFGLGNPGDVGIAGDWNGNGIDTTGVFRPSDGLLYLKNSNDTGFADIALNYGLPGDRPVTGDWDDNGTDTIGIYRAGTFYLRNENTNGFAQLIFALGDPGDMPIAGNWDGLP